MELTVHWSPTHTTYSEYWPLWMLVPIAPCCTAIQMGLKVPLDMEAMVAGAWECGEPGCQALYFCGSIRWTQ